MRSYNVLVNVNDDSGDYVVFFCESPTNQHARPHHYDIPITNSNVRLKCRASSAWMMMLHTLVSVLLFMSIASLNSWLVATTSAPFATLVLTLE